jgi:hypothetical protein
VASVGVRGVVAWTYLARGKSVAETKRLDTTNWEDEATPPMRVWEPVSLLRLGTFGEALVGGSTGNGPDGPGGKKV